MNTTAPHKVVSQEEWIQARQELLAKEKEFTRLRDELAQARLNQPWVRVDKDYVFDSTEGKKTLADLFDGKSQLIIYHFMFAPGWTEGCHGCSFVSDHTDAARQHFENHDLAFAAVSRAPLAEFQSFKKRMGWTFPWLSSAGSDFNYDYQASFHREDLDAGPVFYNFKEQKLRSEDQPGASCFFRDQDGTIYHTYSTYERGLDLLVGAYNWLDIAPLGRNEKEGMDWMCLHDEYEN
jgi:predicted dithiol-disulfide oxidoreductase (DUF899 family)